MLFKDLIPIYKKMNDSISLNTLEYQKNLKYKDYLAVNKEPMLNKIDIRNTLRCSKRSSGSFHTHVSMGTARGIYSFDRDDLKELFDYCGTKQSPYGIAEKPQFYSMLRFDFDFEREQDEPTSLYEIDTFLNDIIPYIRSYLQENIKKFKSKMNDVAIFTKDPYMNNGKVKHGIHLQFYNVFIN